MALRDEAAVDDQRSQLLSGGMHLPASPIELAVEARTWVDPELFEMPVTRLAVSGGTAAFFRLRLKAKAAEERGSVEYYVGKDIAHARDEVNFYEEARALRAADRSPAWSHLLGYMLEYAGVLTVDGQGEALGESNRSSPVSMLVLRNILDGSPGFRLLDLKIGQKTAAANWKGKSRVRAARQDVIDHFTNSLHEGLRLEGVTGAPLSLQSCLALAPGSPSKKEQKKVLLRMRCAEVLMHFMDLQWPEPADDAAGGAPTASEACEAVLRQAAGQLADLALACRRAPVPQKWLGSSVALGFDATAPAARGASSVDGCSGPSLGVRVGIFDWGRSELNTEEKHAELTQTEREDYEFHWRNYIAGIDRLAWECARAHRQRFGNAGAWAEALVTLRDCRAGVAFDDVAEARLAPLCETPRTTVLLSNQSRLTYEVKWLAYPPGCNILGVWRITIVSASNVSSLKGGKYPNLLAEVVAVSESYTADARRLMFRQVTSVQCETSNPEWNEIVEIPIVANPAALEDTLCEVSPDIVRPSLDTVLPSQAALIQTAAKFRTGRLPTTMWIDDCDEESGFAEWCCRLEGCVGRHTDPNGVSGRAAQLVLVRRGPHRVRGLALVSLIWSFFNALFLVGCVWLHVTGEFSGIRTCVILLVAACEAFLGFVLATFELPLQKVQSAGCIGFQDMAIRRGRLHRLDRRGSCYVVLGISWLVLALVRDLPMGMLVSLRLDGVVITAAGLLMHCARCGIVREYAVQKIMRARPGDDAPSMGRVGRSREPSERRARPSGSSGAPCDEERIEMTTLRSQRQAEASAT